MARSKQATPIRRQVSSEYTGKHDRVPRTANPAAAAAAAVPNGMSNGKPEMAPATASMQDNGLRQVVFAVGGIYASFLTWAYLQEKLTTTPYGDAAKPELFKFPVFLNTIQSLFAATTGFLYLAASTPRGQRSPPIIPSRAILLPLLLVAVTSSLASPFGYASLAHIDYITFLLAKSCKLLPVMFLHITVFRKRYPLYKYLVVAAVTAGVAVFTLHGGKRHKHSGGGRGSGETAWGLLLLSINLLFDGLTNSTQDYIFQTFRPYSGPQMMCANNVMQTLVTASYLVAGPYVATTAVGRWVGMDEGAAGGELAAALAFMARHPGVWRDVLGFAACGAVGQVFIFYTLSTFSSVFLVTVTVTRKMVTMMLSVVAFGHRLSRMQWLGVGLVFGGIGVEAQITRREKLAKQAAAKNKKQ
ncbi:uncharacterized protein E0L32_012156 [Thyridium curvatum]|uniref:UDP-galactose transporter homolog 1 n=1 Tax=Thyridium curvatum TaxID=1093900 RepID=A0A507BKX2_9PEZI|nr:uncharacterized protein E0L32_012156 [Thyridium curvatum]TPX17370.1 hypothetical protein E0L32_012156 [Thyridium curvatum]